MLMQTKELFFQSH